MPCYRTLPRSEDFLSHLKNPARPSFFFGTCPPGEGTSPEKARRILAKFCARSAVLATDGFIVSAGQCRAGRTSLCLVCCVLGVCVVSGVIWIIP